MSNANVTEQGRHERKRTGDARLGDANGRAKPPLDPLWEKLGRRRRLSRAGVVTPSVSGHFALDGSGPGEPSSSLGRLYEDVKENGRLSEPPQSPMQLLDFEPAGDDGLDLESGSAPVEGDPSGDESIEVVGGLAMEKVDEVYDEIAEGSVRIPGAGHDEAGPADKDHEWLSMDGIVPS